ncbi:MAG: HlyC/CorC family transporter [Alphaproteobacteria bacterium]|nr:HlyC/CorC family transporter [Alphaproteobacteria bacterium]
MELADMMFSLVAIALCVIASAFFAGAETAVTGMSQSRLFQLIQEGNTRARRIGELLKDKEALIGSLLLGNSAVHILGSALAAGLAIRLWGEDGVFYASAIMTVIVVTFGEVLPKTYAILNNERVTLTVSYFLYAVCWVLTPFVRIVQWIDYPFLRMLGVHDGLPRSLVPAAQAIRGAIDMHHHEGEVEKDDRDMLASILDLGARTVEEIMIHRSQVESINIGLDPEMVIAQAIASSHSRIPLWKDNPENIVGVLHFKDLLRLVRAQKIGLTREMIRRIAHKPWFVPETTSLDDQLDAFRSERRHFACVVDEYGAWLGIVTLEDIIEEIVGEIDDEHDPLVIAEIIPFGDRAYRVAGSVTIRDINRQLEWDLPDEHAATVAGLVLHEARVIPDVGAVFDFFGYRFTIAEKRANQLTQLLVERLVDAFDDTQE